MADHISTSAVDEAMQRQVDAGSVTGLAWASAGSDDIHVGCAGSMHLDGGTPVRRDTIFRISSMTKPVTAVAALSLADDGTIDLEEPVDRLLPELADRRVMVRSDGPLDDTVPAARPISVRELLTFTPGMGMDFSTDGEQPLLGAMVGLGLHVGAPAPSVDPDPDEWMRRLGTLPLSHQPGERWLYNVAADVLGVLIARAAGKPLDVVFAERIFEPLGMADTGFWVPADRLERFGPCFVDDPESGRREVYDPAGGQWSSPPAFPSGAAGLVSTIDDFTKFARMLIGSGALDGERIVSADAVSAMISDQLTDEHKTVSGPDPAGAKSWGYGLAVQIRGEGPHSVGSYGWDGGLGSSWLNDPTTGRIGVLLTNQMWNSPLPPPVVEAFWVAASS